MIMKICVTVIVLVITFSGCVHHDSENIVTPPKEQTVKITGYVAAPGDYRWYPGMTVSNLVDEAGGITATMIKVHIHTNSYLLREAERIVLKPRQRVYIGHPRVFSGGALIMK